MVAELEKSVREKRRRVEDAPLHGEACGPEDRDHSAHGAGERCQAARLWDACAEDGNPTKCREVAQGKLKYDYSKTKG